MGEAGGKHRIGELFLLAAGFAAGIGIVLMFAAVVAPTLGRGKDEPVAHVRDLARPAPVEFGCPFASLEPLDDALDLEEFCFRIGDVFRPGQRTFGAGPEILLEVPDFRVRTLFAFEHDEAVRVVVDFLQRPIDLLDALADRLALQMKLRLEVGDLANGVFVQKLLEACLEARQAVGLEFSQHSFVFAR